MAEYMNKGRNGFRQFDTHFNKLDSVTIKETSFKMKSLKTKGELSQDYSQQPM